MAGQVYQQTRRGRRAHAARQTRYRQRCALQKVTHEYSAPASAPVPPEISAASHVGKWRPSVACTAVPWNSSATTTSRAWS
jgi:hypothetical protein